MSFLFRFSLANAKIPRPSKRRQTSITFNKLQKSREIYSSKKPPRQPYQRKAISPSSLRFIQNTNHIINMYGLSSCSTNNSIRQTKKSSNKFSKSNYKKTKRRRLEDCHHFTRTQLEIPSLSFTTLQPSSSNTAMSPSFSFSPSSKT